MTLFETPGAFKHFCRTSWKFQQTFSTPLQNLQPFVETITTAHEPLSSASVTIDGVVMKPTHLLELFARHLLPANYVRDVTITAVGLQEVQALLLAALSDWADFVVVPTPEPFVIYADHDEFTTFFANTKSNLNRVTDALLRQGFERVKNYERKL